MSKKVNERTIEEIQQSVWDTLDRISQSFEKHKEESIIEAKKHQEELRAEAKKEKEIAKKKQLAFEAKMKKREIAFEKEMKEREIALEKDRQERAAEDLKRKIEFDNEIRKINESMGHYTNNIGYIAEEYFFNSFKAGKKNFFGENINRIEKNVKGINKDFRDEYDILLINKKTIIIIEVKNKANLNDIPKIQRKAETFRINFPEYKELKVYLGFASKGFYDEIEHECKEKGIAIIKQVGDTLIIFDENLKVY